MVIKKVKSLIRLHFNQEGLPTTIALCQTLIQSIPTAAPFYIYTHANQETMRYHQCLGQTGK